jgi:UTP--glucose-1-phosphate uridylyltransferase
MAVTIEIAIWMRKRTMRQAYCRDGRFAMEMIDVTRRSSRTGSFRPMTTTPIKTVIPAAGLGTRFLPATKAMPKEMLPVVDKPAIQYVVEEAVAAGSDDVLMIVGRNKNALANHFDRVAELEHTLLEKGEADKLEKVMAASRLADIHFVRQGDPLGLGHAILRARKHVGDETFAVLLGDDLIDARDPLLGRMITVARERSATVIALMEVNPSQIHLYGCAAVEATDEDDLVKVTGLVEKPSAEDAPSNLAVIGRYVLRPEIFRVLESTPPGKGGEIQLTDALETLVGDEAIAGPVLAVVFRGRRYDTGDRLDYLKSNILMALDRDDLGPGLAEWITELGAELGASKPN